MWPRPSFDERVGGLLSECQRTWAAEGFTPDLTDLLDAAAALPPGGPQINPDDSAFIAPDNMPDRIRATVRHIGDVLPCDPATITRCIMDSLATGYARAIADAERLAGRAVHVVHVVGGGSQNRLLCQLTADTTGKKVVAGPVEATAVGNVLVQARAAGRIGGGLTELPGGGIAPAADVHAAALPPVAPTTPREATTRETTPRERTLAAPALGPQVSVRAKKGAPRV